MPITVFTKPKAVITVLFALIFLWDANLVLSICGIEVGAGGQLVARILGGAYLGVGIGFWLISSELDISYHSAGLYALGEFIAAGICFTAISEGTLNALGYVLAVGYLLFGCGFLWVANKVTPEQVAV